MAKTPKFYSKDRPESEVTKQTKKVQENTYGTGESMEAAMKTAGATDEQKEAVKKSAETNKIDDTTQNNAKTKEERDRYEELLQKEQENKSLKKDIAEASKPEDAYEPKIDLTSTDTTVEVPEVNPIEPPKGEMPTPNKEIGETEDDTATFTEANNSITETLGEEEGADFVNTATEAMAEAGVPTTDSKEEIETGKDALDNQLGEEGFVHQSVDANGNRVTTRLTPEEFAELSKDLNRKEKLGKILTGISFAITALTGGRIMPINFRQMLEPTDDEVAAYNDYTKAIDQLKAADDEYNKTKSTGDAEAVNIKSKSEAEAEAKYAGVDEYNKRVEDLAEQYSDEDIEAYAKEHNMSPEKARTAMAKDALHTSGYEVGKLENELSGKSEAGDDEFNKLLKLKDKDLAVKLTEMMQQLANDKQLSAQNYEIQKGLASFLQTIQNKAPAERYASWKAKFPAASDEQIRQMAEIAGDRSESWNTWLKDTSKGVVNTATSAAVSAATSDETKKKVKHTYIPAERRGR